LEEEQFWDSAWVYSPGLPLPLGLFMLDRYIMLPRPLYRTVTLSRQFLLIQQPTVMRIVPKGSLLILHLPDSLHAVSGDRFIGDGRIAGIHIMEGGARCS